MRKIDIHCHVLPEVDDGASCSQEALLMLKAAAAQGMRTVIATPHYSAEFRIDNPEDVRCICEKLEQKAREKISPKIRVYPGQEIFYSEESIEKLKNGSLLTLAESRYVLVEFWPSAPYSNLFSAVRELTMAQYIPILAHVERYGVLREKGKIEELIESGAYMQMNYRHIGGKWYDKTTRWCRKMLKEENIHFLGTDMHNIKTRKPQTQKAERWMEKHLNREYFRGICYKNAECVLENIKI